MVTLLLSRMFKSLLKTSISGGAILFIQTDQGECGYVYIENTGDQNSKNTEKFINLYLQAK